VVEARLTISVKYCLWVPVFHFRPKLMYPAARSLCDSWASCINNGGGIYFNGVVSRLPCFCSISMLFPAVFYLCFLLIACFMCSFQKTNQKLHQIGETISSSDAWVWELDFVMHTDMVIVIDVASICVSKTACLWYISILIHHRTD